MIWAILPYAIGALILATFVLILVLLGVSAWECRREPEEDFSDDLRAYMETLEDPANSCTMDMEYLTIEEAHEIWREMNDNVDRWKTEVQEYRTNYGRKMDKR